jgi:mRNA-degrading endonuclease RelE of RelBE toxin-antitoxin system
MLSQTALRQYKRLSANMQRRIKTKLNELKEDPFTARAKADIKRLKGPKRDYFRLKIGDHRAIYVVEGKKVLVAKILPRSKAYDWIE